MILKVFVYIMLFLVGNCLSIWHFLSILTMFSTTSFLKMILKGINYDAMYYYLSYNKPRHTLNKPKYVQYILCFQFEIQHGISSIVLRYIAKIDCNAHRNAVNENVCSVKYQS